MSDLSLKSHIDSIVSGLDNPTVLHTAIVEVIWNSYRSTGKHWFGCRHGDWMALARLSRNQYWRARGELREAGILLLKRSAESITSRPIIYHALAITDPGEQTPDNTYIYEGDKVDG